jgi:hypothetical protein
VEKDREKILIEAIDHIKQSKVLHEGLLQNDTLNENQKKKCDDKKRKKVFSHFAIK